MRERERGSWPGGRAAGGKVRQGAARHGAQTLVGVGVVFFLVFFFCGYGWEG